MSKKEFQLPEGVTPEMVKAWKDQHGEKDIKLADLLDEDGTVMKVVVIRTPKRRDMGEFEKWIDRNPDKAKSILVNACILSSKEEVLANEDLFLAAFDACAKAIPVRTAILKNL